MVVIENEVGRFEGETEKEALKLARAAKRKQRSEDRKRQKSYEVARKRSQEFGFEVLVCMGDREGVPSGWRLYQPSDNRFPDSRREDSHRFYRLRQHKSDYETGEWKVYQGLRHSDKVIGVMERGGTGHAVAWLETSGEVEAFTVGINDGVVALSRLPKVYANDLWARLEDCEAARDRK